MKIILILLITVITISCGNKSVVSNGNNTNNEPAQKEENNSVKKHNLNLNEYPDSLFASIERTPCYGRCSTYKIKIYESGYMLYEGIRFTKMIGAYYNWASKGEMDSLKQEAKAIDYFNLKDDYNSPITDIPSVITYIRIGKKRKRIRNRRNAPQELTDFATYFDEMFKGRDWVLIKTYNDK